MVPGDPLCAVRPVQFVTAAPPSPGCPLPAFTATRVSVTVDPLTNTAMLEAGVALGVAGALIESNSKSSKVTPVVDVPVTCNA